MEESIADGSVRRGSPENLLPELGFRNYWYPIIESRHVKKRPVPVRVLGEDLVLFRGNRGRVAALVDRCPHRGTKLSRGRIIFPGTLSCGYHGWTYNEKGEWDLTKRLYYSAIGDEVKDGYYLKKDPDEHGSSGAVYHYHREAQSGYHLVFEKIC